MHMRCHLELCKVEEVVAIGVRQRPYLRERRVGELRAGEQRLRLHAAQLTRRLLVEVLEESGVARRVRRVRRREGRGGHAAQLIAPVLSNLRGRRRLGAGRHQLEQRQCSGGAARPQPRLLRGECERVQFEAQVRRCRLEVGPHGKAGEVEPHAGARRSAAAEARAAAAAASAAAYTEARQVGLFVEGGVDGRQREAQLRARPVAPGRVGVGLQQGVHLARRRVQRAQPRRVQLQPHGLARVVARHTVRHQLVRGSQLDPELGQPKQRRLARHRRVAEAALQRG
eukprot:scaffold121674_cov63-Phaeocystis_antarctica.AAC.1